MPKVNLSGMTIEALMDLRKRVDETLSERRAELQHQLEMIAVVGGRRVAVRGRRSLLKGKKSRRNIEVRQAIRGQAEGQDLVGLLLRSRKGRSWRIF
jgi:hypothetical protein